MFPHTDETLHTCQTFIDTTDYNSSNSSAITTSKNILVDLFIFFESKKSATSELQW